MTSHRKLGYWETFNALVHDKLDGHGNLAAVIRLSNRVSITQFKLAAEILFKHFELLRTQINVDNEGHYQLMSSAKFSMVKIVEHTQPDSWTHIYQQVLRLPYDLKKSVWQLHLVNNDDDGSHIVLGISHAIADGLSCARLLNNFVLAINQNPLEPDTGVLPAIETLIDKSLFVKERSQIIKNDQFNNKLTVKFENKDPGIKNRATGNYFSLLTYDKLSALKMACHEHGVTINAILNAALLKAKSKLLASNDFSLELLTPINLRNFSLALEARNSLGCQVTMVNTLHQQVKEMSIWQLALDYQAQLKVQINEAANYPEKFSLLDIMPYVDLCQTKREVFIFDSGITNIGQYHFNHIKEGRFQVEEFYFAASRQAADMALLLCVATIPEKGLFMDFSYTKPIVSEKTITRIAKGMLESLIDCLKP